MEKLIDKVIVFWSAYVIIIQMALFRYGFRTRAPETNGNTTPLRNI